MGTVTLVKISSFKVEVIYYDDDEEDCRTVHISDDFDE